MAPTEQKGLTTPACLGLLALMAMVLLFQAVTVDFPNAITGFVGDLAVYLAMGQSFAFDRDCVYDRGDLRRIYLDWGTGPGGVFLKKKNNTLTYAKPIIYPLLSAPLVRLLGINGFLVFNALCFMGMIVLGWLFLRRSQGDPRALLISSVFFVFQIGIVYQFTIAPETFTMFCVLAAFFCWLHPAPWQSAVGQHLYRFRYLLGGIFLGLATFSKLTNALLIIALVLERLIPVKHERDDCTGITRERELLSTRLLQVFAGVMAMSIVIFFFFGLQFHFTGDINYQGGYRKVFNYPSWPFIQPGVTFDNSGFEISPDKTISVDQDAGLVKKIIAFIFQRAQYTDIRMIVADIGYFFVGRVGGLLPFFPAALVAIFLAVRGRRRTDLSLLMAVLVTVSLFFLVMPQNYVGGAALGNRYFLNTYPVFLFMFVGCRSWRCLIVPIVAGSFFLSQLILTPYQSNYNLGNITTRFPFTLLPLEQSLIANYPSNVHRRLNFVPFSANPSRRLDYAEVNPGFHVTFADHNTFGYEWAMEREGFWVRGDSTAEFIVRYPGPAFTLTVTIQNGPAENTIRLKVAGASREQANYAPGETKQFTYSLPHPFPYFGHSLVKCSIRNSNGFIPMFDLNEANDDARLLGCFVSLKVDPLTP